MNNQQIAQAIVAEMAGEISFNDRDARIHSRIAVLDYARAYRRLEIAPSQTAALIESGWVHLERAVKSGASRTRLERLFARIRSRLGMLHE
jgi:hypothetical protein